MRYGDGREAGRQLPDHVDAVAREVEGRAHGDAEEEHHEPSGNLPEPPLAGEQDGERCGTDEERRTVRLVQMGDQVVQLVDRVPVDALDPEELWQLLDGDEDREAEHEALDDRLREELRDEPEPEEAGKQEEPAAEEDHRGGVDEVLRGARGVQRDDRRGEQHRRRRGAGRDDVAARPEDRIGGERDQERVEPCLGREAGETGVGDHLGHQQSPHRRAGDRVVAEVRAVVPRQPRRAPERTFERLRAGAPPTTADRRSPSVPKATSRNAYSPPKTVAQSSRMLTTVQPWAAACSSEASAPAVYANSRSSSSWSTSKRSAGRPFPPA